MSVKEMSCQHEPPSFLRDLDHYSWNDHGVGFHFRAVQPREEQATLQ